MQLHFPGRRTAIMPRLQTLLRDGYARFLSFSHWDRTLAGMEITRRSIRTVRLEQDAGGLRPVAWAETPFPEETLKLSYRSLNILDQERFLSTLQKALDEMGGTVFRIGLSLPNEIVKLIVQEFEGLPATQTERDRMISWWADKTLRIPAAAAKSTCQPLGETPDGQQRLLIAIGFTAVIREYEDMVKKVGIDAEVVRPGAVHQFNLYRKVMPPAGVVGFMGFFDQFFCLFVIDQNELVYYRGIRGLVEDTHFVQQVEMIFLEYEEQRPNHRIEWLYTSCPRERYESFLGKGENIIFLEPGRILLPAAESENPASPAMPPARFDVAIGAALSLARPGG